MLAQHKTLALAALQSLANWCRGFGLSCSAHVKYQAKTVINVVAQAMLIITKIYPPFMCTNTKQVSVSYPRSAVEQILTA